MAGHEAPPADVATAEKMAQGRMRKLAEGFVTAEVEMIGDPALVPGALLTLDKIGDGLDGTYRVERAHHRFDKHGYLTRFKAVRTAKKKPPAPQKGPKEKPAHWLSLELADPEGNPLAGQQYRVETADGRVVEGRLDAAGKAVLTGIKPGNNYISFPGLNLETRRA